MCVSIFLFSGDAVFARVVPLSHDSVLFWPGGTIFKGSHKRMMVGKQKSVLRDATRTYIPTRRQFCSPQAFFGVDGRAWETKRRYRVMGPFFRL